MNALVLADSSMTNLNNWLFSCTFVIVSVKKIKRKLLLKIWIWCLRREYYFKYRCGCIVCWVTIQNKAKTSCIVRNLLQIINWPRLLLCKGLAHTLWGSLVDMIHKKYTNTDVLGKTFENRVKGRHGCMFNEIWLV